MNVSFQRTQQRDTRSPQIRQAPYGKGLAGSKRDANAAIQVDPVDLRVLDLAVEHIADVQHVKQTQVRDCIKTTQEYAVWADAIRRNQGSAQLHERLEREHAAVVAVGRVQPVERGDVGHQDLVELGSYEQVVQRARRQVGVLPLVVGSLLDLVCLAGDAQDSSGSGPGLQVGGARSGFPIHGRRYGDKLR